MPNKTVARDLLATWFGTSFEANGWLLPELGLLCSAGNSHNYWKQANLHLIRSDHGMDKNLGLHRQLYIYLVFTCPPLALGAQLVSA
jgi:hypothetical protein